MAKGEKIPCLGKASSLQVMKSWLEILDTSGSRWAYWSIPQKKLTEIFYKHKISECTGLTPPYERSKAACKTFLEASTRLLPHLDLDQSIRGWAGGETASRGMEEVLKAFLSQEQTGVKDLIVIKSKKLLSMLSFLDSKQALAEAILSAHEGYITTNHLALQTQGRIMREECSKSQGLQNIKGAIADIHTVFNASRTFLLEGPEEEAAEGATLAFGNHPLKTTFNFAHIQQILELVGSHSPRLVMHYLPMVGQLQEEQPFACLMKDLQEVYNRVAELTFVEKDIVEEEASKEVMETDPVRPPVETPLVPKGPGPTTHEVRAITGEPIAVGSLPPPEVRHQTGEHLNVTMSTLISEGKPGGPERQSAVSKNPDSPEELGVRVVGRLARAPDALMEGKESTNRQFVPQEEMAGEDRQAQPVGSLPR